MKFLKFPIRMLTYSTGLMLATFTFSQKAVIISNKSQNGYENKSYLVTNKLKLTQGFKFKAGKDGTLFFSRITNEQTISKGREAPANNLGLSIIEEASFSFYPNPVDNELTISGMELKGSTLEIYDLEGKLVYKAEGMTNNTAIDMRRIRSGTYILKIHDYSQTFERKLIIQH